MANPPFFSYLLFALCTLSISSSAGSKSDYHWFIPADFLSINCGSSLSHTDQNGVVWTGDDSYARSGAPHSVRSSNSISRVMDTLRVFTTRIKNCYHIGSVRRGRVLLRATFYYGNYDNRSSPPAFDLHFDGNYWATVQTSSSEAVWYEVIYTTRRESISVCVAQTKAGEFPLITAVEVRGLEAFMYRNYDAGYPLLSGIRVAFGSNATVRYPEDPYDRRWFPAATTNRSLQVSTSTALFPQPLYLFDRPPSAVLKHAVTAMTPNSSIDLFMRFLPDARLPVYINFFFSELSRPEPNRTRSFRLFKDDELFFSAAILPPYENCSAVYTSNITASSRTKFSLVPTDDSALPPLINAMEVFVVGRRLADGSHRKDVQGLASLQKAFTILQSWSGDPCLPANYTWDWILCNYDRTPRLTSLFLGGFGLSGLLPDLSSMDALQTIDLQNNSLRGPIPDFLATLPNLKILNLANNQFNGSIPASLSTKKGLTLVVAGNPDLCLSLTPCEVSSKIPSSSCFERKMKSNIPLILFINIILSIVILH